MTGNLKAQERRRTLSVIAVRWLWAVVLGGCLIQPSTGAARTLTVGVYNNEPKVYTDAQGNATGLFIDLLQEIANANGWTLEFKRCNWTQCLDWLRAGSLDLMPDVAYSEARDTYLDFHRSAALNSWSQLYSRAETKLVSLFQLDGRRVTVLSGSIQQSAFQDLIDGFGIDATLEPVDSYTEAFDRVRGGEADAAVSNHLYGALHAAHFGLTETPLVFQPVELFYATGAGRNADVLAAIDDQLARWRHDPESTYFEVLNRWQTLPAKPLVPPKLVATLVAAIALCLVAVGIAFWLRRQVHLRTRDLRDSEAKLATILDSVGAFIYIKDRDGRYRYANRKVLDSFGMTETELVGRTDTDFIDEETAGDFIRNDRHVLAEGEPLTIEEELRYGNDQGTYVSVKIPLKDQKGEIYALCGISTDITEQKKREQKIYQLAYHDLKTGLPNRTYLLDHLDHLIKDRADGEGIALIVVDLDHFKNINDSRGQRYGDDLLREVAYRLQGLLPDRGHLIHLGADGFALLVSGIDANSMPMSVRKLCNQTLASLRRRYQWRNFSYHCTASIGVALIEDETRSTLEDLLKNAELAMHQAKRSGRNRSVFYAPGMQETLQHRLGLESDLRDSLQQDHFQLVYQMQVNDTGRITGAEALLRWHHPTRGTVSPGEFIPVAENSGLILPLGHWVLETACRQLADWKNDTATAHLTLSVNVSAWQFRSDDFVSIVRTLLHRTGADATRLKVELTESVLVEDLDDAIAKITALNRLGVRVSLDDFGTGYSSLAYLKRLTLAQLKIDQSFVADVLVNPVVGSITRAIITLGHSLGIEVIAEGVETEAHVRWLAEAGCHAYQGYYFGRPVSAEVFRSELGDRPEKRRFPNVG